MRPNLACVIVCVITVNHHFNLELPAGVGQGPLELFFRADSKNLGATAPFWVAMADFFTFCQAARCSSPHKVPKKLAALIATPPHAQCRPPTFGHHHLCQPARPIGPSLPMGNNLTLHQTTRFTCTLENSFSEVGRVGWHGVGSSNFRLRTTRSPPFFGQPHAWALHAM